jgi:beta-carotene hydroxylase
MGLKNKADRRTLAWLVFSAANVAIVFVHPSLRWWLCPLGCYFALAAGIIAHNHNHCPTFRNRTANDWMNHAATAFYGFAAFNWVPTHNANHHKFTNAEGDATITWRLTNRHHLPMAIAYPFVSTWYQLPLIDRYLKDAKERRPSYYRHLMAQLVICWGLPLGLTLVNWRAAVCALWIPRLFSLWTIMYFNYAQHVHCAAGSAWNHSRNFTNQFLNFLLFNNGFHTVHHMKPGAHWSALPAMHAEVEAHIHPALNQRSFGLWLIDCYLIAPFVKSHGTHPITDATGGERTDLDEPLVTRSPAPEA